MRSIDSASSRPRRSATSSASSRCLPNGSASTISSRASTLDDVWTRHVADSLQLLEHAPPTSANGSISEAAPGFPGSSSRSPARSFRSGISRWSSRTRRRPRSCARRSARPAPTRPSRTSGSKRMRQKWRGRADVVSARALAPLPELARARRALRARGTRVMLFLKGREYVQELEAASQSFDFDVVDYAERNGFGRSRARHPQSQPKGERP